MPTGSLDTSACISSIIILVSRSRLPHSLRTAQLLTALTAQIFGTTWATIFAWSPTLQCLPTICCCWLSKSR